MPRPRRWPTRRCSELLSLARQLRPTALDDLGLTAAIAGQVEQLARGEIEAEFAPKVTSPTSTTIPSWSSTASPRRPFPTRLATAAPPTSRSRFDAATPTASSSRSHDDGRGFAFDESEGGLGIAGMRERALLIGAKLTIESRPGHGTTVRLTVPD